MFEYEKTKMSWFFEGSSNCHPFINLPAEEIANLIKSNEDLKNKITRVREYKPLGKKAYDAEKKTLPYVTTSGIFTYRNDASLVTDTYTHIGVLDLDVNLKRGLNTDINITETKQLLTEDESIILVADSPGGYIKAWVALKVGEHAPEDHYQLMKQVILPHYAEKYGCLFDTGQVKLSQPFFLTSDPDAYIEFDVTPVDLDYKIKEYKDKFKLDFFGNNVNSPYPNEYILKKISSIYHLEKGEIWNKLGGMCFWLGNLSGDGRIKIEPEEIMALLENAVNAANNITDKKLQIKNARSSFLNGFYKKY